MKSSILCGIVLFFEAGCSYDFKTLKSTALDTQHTDRMRDSDRTDPESDTTEGTSSDTGFDTGSNSASNTSSDTGSELPCVDDSIESPCWFDSAWEHRHKISILASRVAGTDQPYFPLLISATYPEWKGPAHSGQISRADGGDIVFTSNDAGTQLKHEIEQYDPSSGRLVVWVQVPLLSSSTDTVIYMYYGNPMAQDQGDASGVWDNGGDNHFKAVWHMSQAGLENRLDSTLNGNHCVPVAYEGTEKVPGVAGDADKLDGLNGLLSCGKNSSLNIRNQITLSAWLKPSSPRIKMGQSSSLHATYPYNLYLYGTSDTRTTVGVWFSINGAVHDIWQPANIDIPTDSWAYIVTTFDGHQIKVYVNAQLDFTVPVSGTIDVSALSPLTIGEPDYLFAGAIDEVLISQIAQSPDWITTSYNNQSSPNTFYTVGPRITF